MAIQLPGELVWVMDLLGLPWPDVDEDKVREYAGHVKSFAGNIDRTHAAATATLRQMAQAYQADSYNKLAARWTKMSNEHMTEIVTALNASAIALDAAADAIVATKLAVIAQLGILAAELVAGTIATIATAGAAAAAEAALVAATRKIVSRAIKEAQEMIIGVLIAKAVEPLQETVEKAVKGLVFEGVKRATGGAVTAGPAGTGFSINPQQLALLADRLKAHADEVRGHAKAFTTATGTVSFS
ncbi:WXG100-like domain-containing protein [Kitasatospora sp. NPDC054939]